MVDEVEETRKLSKVLDKCVHAFKEALNSQRAEPSDLEEVDYKFFETALENPNWSEIILQHRGRREKGWSKDTFVIEEVAMYLLQKAIPTFEKVLRKLDPEKVSTSPAETELKTLKRYLENLF